ncbi:putative tartrate dehydrogenase [Agrobacterium fabacearum CFBP 5771]|jgi:tartrate dehydrogenase/decarboxylase/D-malate dehydrogenase|uniref:tartrate dehydrogenase n=1 Tax=Agrobacterium tumefaciens TaxID=358 RepID=UPI0009B9F0B6|nr:tartrate dehydrogenase [Agrobacterium tumefaciens]CVI24847.1 putative tartrate dehydrogenase [Agrobacterium fabacearum CFBP 5771]
MTDLKIAIIPGDGIGVEVTAAAWEISLAAAAACGIKLSATTFPWSCDHYVETGSMMPADGIETLRAYDAILLGAIGWPAKVSDDVSLHGLLLRIRKEFDLYANVRPHKLLPGVQGPLRAGNIDVLCIRENTEGEYSGAGGRVHRGTAEEVAVETSVFTRNGVERILRYGFETARKRRKLLASVTKSNAQRHSMVFWDDVTRELSTEYPDVEVRSYHVDAIAARMIMFPETLDVIVASNLFGDILSDIGAAIQGGLGFAASANIDPTGRSPSMFEPVHGSAPDIADKDAANPIAATWSAAMMFEHLGQTELATTIFEAIGRACSRGIGVGSPDSRYGTRHITSEILFEIARSPRGHLP